ncbi:MAG: RNA polymerase sigma factor [Gemmatimonadota bacterium]
MHPEDVTKATMARATAAGNGELVEQARGGDREALNTLLSLYLADVFDVTFRVLGERDEAEDAVQEAFINAVRGLPRFRGDASFRTWLLRIALNTARSALRRKGRKRESTLTAVSDLAGDGPDPAEAAIQVTESERVHTLLAELPEKQRLAVTMRVFQGLSHREIAEVTGSTEGAVRVNYHLGIKRLKEWMQ